MRWTRRLNWKHRTGAGAMAAAAALAGACSAPSETPQLSDAQLLEASIPQLQEALDSGRLSSRDLVERYLSRIEAYDQQGPALNAVTVVNPDATAEAEKLDAERAATGPRGPLHGIPIILKDNYETHDLQTANGSKSLEDWIPPHDAFLVEQLRRAGAIVIAKATMHEFARGITNVGSLFGQTLNPYALERNPGGSSGGTGAAVAAGFAAFGMGSDTCGSIRIPSSHNNLVGLRGTQGLLSRRGIIPLSSTQDIGGPLVKSVTDLAIVFDALVGYDPADPQTAAAVGRVPDSYTESLLADGLVGARIGLVTALLGDEPEDEEVAGGIRSAVAELKAAGATVIEVEIPDLAELLPSEYSVHSVLNYDFRHDLDDYLNRHDTPVKSIAQILEGGGYHPSVERTLRRALELGPRDSQEFLASLAKRALLREAILRTMADHELDALAYPTIRRKAAPIGERQEGSNCRVSANSGLPAISAPAGFTNDGLPVGLELLGRAWSEPLLIQLAYAHEQSVRHRRPPAATPPLQR